MPIYEYQCQHCGHELEKLQKISDQPLTDCPDCKQPSLTKLVSAAGFQLKGSGWYVTDFRDKAKKPAAKTEKPTEKKADKTTDTPATKPASKDNKDKS